MTKGAGDKAFCAGGDVVAIAKAGKSGGSLTADFFRDEYQLDYRLAHMRLPHVALMDGITMGGGVGLSVHSSHRVVTERTMFAMPETAIGFFPDVGGAHFLPRLDGRLGLFLALTGHRLKAGDVLYSGVGTAYVPSARLPELERALAEVPEATDAAVAEVIESFAELPEGPPAIIERRADIDRLFASDNVAEVLAALDADGAAGNEWAEKTAATIRRMSPASCVVSALQLAEGAKLDLAECLKMEYRISQRFMEGDDFYEGIRAVLIDKDNAPVWPSEIATTDAHAYLARLPDDAELVLPPSVVAPSHFGLVRDADIRAAIAGGATGVEAVAAALGSDVMRKAGNREKIEAVLALE